MFDGVNCFDACELYLLLYECNVMLCFKSKGVMLLAQRGCVFDSGFERMRLFFELLKWCDVVVVKIWVLL